MKRLSTTAITVFTALTALAAAAMQPDEHAELDRAAVQVTQELLAGIVADASDAAGAMQ